MGKKSIRNGIVVLLGAGVLLIIDQLVKVYVLDFLRPVGQISLIPGLFELSYVENTGAAFGLFKDQMWLLVAITATAGAIIVFLLFRYVKHTFWSYAAAMLILAGGIGNLLDRFFYGFVVDYLHVLFFDYIFNFADCCITVGAVCLVIHMFILYLQEKKEAKAALNDSEMQVETAAANKAVAEETAAKETVNHATVETTAVEEPKEESQA